MTRPFEGYVRGWVTSLAECGECQLTFSVRREPPARMYDDIYKQAAAIPGYNRYLKYAERVVRERDPGAWLAAQEDTYRVVFDWIASNPTPVSVLEIGSGLGYLTYSLRRRGLDAVGMDVSTDALVAARQRYRDPEGFLEPSQVKDRHPAGFDVVIALETIEHVPDPVSFTRDCMAYLKSGGTLLMSTPNRDAFTKETLWDSDVPPVHLTWFGTQSMRVLASMIDADLQVVDLRSERTSLIPIAGSNDYAAPLLTEDGRVTARARFQSSSAVHRYRALVAKVGGARLQRRPLPGVPRQAPVAPTSTTLGVAMSPRHSKTGVGQS